MRSVIHIFNQQTAISVLTSSVLVAAKNLEVHVENSKNIENISYQNIMCYNSNYVKEEDKGEKC